MSHQEAASRTGDNNKLTTNKQQVAKKLHTKYLLPNHYWKVSGRAYYIPKILGFFQCGKTQDIHLTDT